MRFEGTSSLALLENLALLYLGLAQGADGELDDAEAHTITARLRRWQPHRDPALINHVVRDVMLSYRDEIEGGYLHEVVEDLGRSLPEERRRTVLRDLREIAYADGQFVREERVFIRDVADAWHLSWGGDVQPQA